ncbi:MAG: tRNA adenosine(34) deaminase TadA [Propionibacteriaceae bacterium]
MTPADLVGLALVEAQAAIAHDDVPIGAIVVDAAGVVLGVGHNERELNGDPLAHAEIVALRAAARRRGNWRLDDCTLAVTLEPCVMCAGAIAQARLNRVVFGAFDEKAGAVASLFDTLRDPRLPHRVDVVAGVRAEECAELLSAFFGDRRRN